MDGIAHREMLLACIGNIRINAEKMKTKLLLEGEIVVDNEVEELRSLSKLAGETQLWSRTRGVGRLTTRRFPSMANMILLLLRHLQQQFKSVFRYSRHIIRFRALPNLESKSRISTILFYIKTGMKAS